MSDHSATKANGRSARFGFLGSQIESDLRLRSYVPNFEQDEHAHEETQLTMLLAGSVEEWSAGQRFESGPLDVIVKPARVSHSNRFGPSNTLTLQVSLGPGGKNVLQSFGVSLNRVTWRSGESATRQFLQAVATKADRASSDCVTTGRRTIPRNSRRQAVDPLALSLNLPRQQTSDKPTPDWLVEVWRQLNTRFATSLTVRSLAKEAGVHPVHLTRTIRQHFGVSVTGRLRQLRAAATAGMLCQTELPLSSIATDCGFADQSHMCRVFKSYTSLTPLEFRRLTDG